MFDQRDQVVNGGQTNIGARRTGEDGGRPLFRHTGEALDLADEELERQAQRDAHDGDFQDGRGLDFTAMSSDHERELVAAGAKPLLTLRIWKLPSNECRVIKTSHLKPAPDALTTEREAAIRIIDFAHSLALDIVRRAIDEAHGVGEATGRLFSMAVDDDWNANLEDHSPRFHAPITEDDYAPGGAVEVEPE